MPEESSPKFSRLKVPGRGTTAEEKKVPKSFRGRCFYNKWAKPLQPFPWMWSTDGDKWTTVVQANFVLPVAENRDPDSVLPDTISKSSLCFLTVIFHSIFQSFLSRRIIWTQLDIFSFIAPTIQKPCCWPATLISVEKSCPKLKEI